MLNEWFNKQSQNNKSKQSIVPSQQIDPQTRIMINSLFISNNHLFTLSSTSALSVYNLADLTSEPHKSLPRLQSGLGICLRKPSAVFEVPSMGHDAKMLAHQVSISNQRQAVFIYDHQSIVGLNLSDLSSNLPSLQVVFQFKVGSLSQNIQKGQKISTVTIVNGSQNQYQNLLITTSSGEIYLIKLTSLMGFEVVKFFSAKNLQTSKTSQIMTESEQNSLGLFNPTQKSQLNNNEYISAAQSDSKSVYLATNKHRLLTVNKESLEVQDVFDTNELSKNGAKSLGQPIKVVLVRNTVLVLYSRALLEFNAYTHTLTNTLTLPFPTLDFTLIEFPKTLQSHLLLIGQCNSLFSTPYPVKQPLANLSRQVSPRSVSISSRMGKSITVRNSLVFVGGSDGTVDVLLNGEMLLAVLVQER